MKKCLIWGMAEVYNETVLSVKYHEIKNNFKVMGITSNATIYEEFDGYKYINKKDINPKEFDFVIVMAKNKEYHEIIQEALNLGFKRECIIKSDVVNNPLFDINKYLNILKNKPTIFSNNCWGGLTYHQLGLEFNSPLINLWFWDDDYIKFLKNPKFYINQELNFDKWGYSGGLQRNFPIAICDDISINFNHYNTFEEANEKWEERKKRINWDNIIIEMFTCNPMIEEAFNDLPYEKKVCFVPYKTDKKYSIGLDCIIKNEFSNFDIQIIINRLAKNRLLYYNPFDLLETGNISCIAKFKKS